jgi:hypothetical protein
MAAAFLGKGLFDLFRGRGDERAAQQNEMARRRMEYMMSRDPRRELANSMRLMLMRAYGLDKYLSPETLALMEHPGRYPGDMMGMGMQQRGIWPDLGSLIFNTLGTLPGSKGRSNNSGWQRTGLGNEVYLPPNNLMSPYPMYPSSGRG